MTQRERLDGNFAVFNGHVNNASDRADQEFKLQFGEELFNKHIQPLHDQGIMVVFQSKPTIHTMAWVCLVTAFVNEGTRRRTREHAGASERGRT